MRSSTPSVRLAGQDLGSHRHAVALVEGPADADHLLLPFMLEGLEHGERVISIVDPAVRGAHVERLGAAGVAVESLTESRQLDVRTWDEAYLRGGRFDRSAQLADTRAVILEGSNLGFPTTRLIGSAEWARDPETVRDLLRYELRLDAMLQRLPSVTVCTYDLNHHSARTIAEVLAIHPVALVGGVLQTTPGAARAAPRERLLATAGQLFHEQGIQATGVDALIEAAGIAKATFYRHFRSKDELVVAWLADEQTNWFREVRRAAEDRATSPAEVIPALFEAAAEWFEADGFRGCPYLNAAVEITDPDHPARRVIGDFLDYMVGQLTELAAAAGMPDPPTSGRELHILLAGSISQALARYSARPYETAREAAARLVESAQPAPEAGDPGA